MYIEKRWPVTTEHASSPKQINQLQKKLERQNLIEKIYLIFNWKMKCSCFTFNGILIDFFLRPFWTLFFLVQESTQHDP